MYDNDVVSDFEEYNYCDNYSDLYLDYDNFDCDFDFDFTDFTDNTVNIDYTKNSILGFNVFSENLPRQLTAESKHTSPHSNVSLSDNYLDYLEYNSTKSFITVQKEKDMTENNMNSVTMFNFVSFNVEGLNGKINYSDLLCLIKDHDFICLSETFLTESIDLGCLVDYVPFFSPAVKLSKRGRPSGGILCMMKSKYCRYVKQLPWDVGNILVFVVDKSLFNLDKDILVLCAYLHPEGSDFYDTVDANGISLMESCLVKFVTDYDVYVIITGDLNSRTSDISSESAMFKDDINTNDVSSGPTNVGRDSQDKNLNRFGKLLLNMCTAFDLKILNGSCHGDLEGCYTFVCKSGCSVVDYFIMSSELANYFAGSIKLNVLQSDITKHLPVSLEITVCDNSNCKIEHIQEDMDNRDMFTEKYVWNEDYMDTYIYNIDKSNFEGKLQFAIDMLSVTDLPLNILSANITKALETFNNIIREASTCMKKRSKNTEKITQKWFDIECKQLRCLVRKKYRIFQSSLSRSKRYNLSDADHIKAVRDDYCNTRKEYKRLLNKKKKEFNNSVIKDLVLTIGNQQEFWNRIRNIMPKRRNVHSSIPKETWFRHFSSLLDREIITENALTDHTDENDEIFENNPINRPISEEEILLAIKKLKKRKSAGPDCITSEFLKNACPQILPFFVKFLNALFDKGIFPEQWTESIIIPLYKKGNINDPKNYRGISLTDISSKIYGSIINNRLQTLVKQNNLTGEIQAGFKEGYSTVDHIFTLLSCVQKQFHKNRKLYVAFIDFEKAFDSINRNLLWPVLSKNRIEGKMYRCIRSMYDNVKAKVRCGDELTDPIQCTYGVKQGDICSPVLFTLFINELAIDVINAGRHGVTLSFDVYELFLLLLADDIVLLSETPVGLQNQLNVLCQSAKRLQLKVNIDKSNIIVFRKGGYLGRREMWTFDGKVMPVVNCYKYLGILFSTKLSFSAACNDLASKAKRALVIIIKQLKALDNYSLELFIKLFDSQVLPIMQYGSEVWGLDKNSILCEKTHLFAVKNFLNVDICTPNDLVYGEMKRYPITINFAINTIRYWLKVLEMDNRRLPKKAYSMLFDLDSKGKHTWASNIRNTLCKYGFGYAWWGQGVGNKEMFLKNVKQRLIDCRWQEWHNHLELSNRFDLYKEYKQNIGVETYLLMNLDKAIVNIITRFRLGISQIKVHCNRYREFEINICPVCNSGLENEVHVFFKCSAYDDIRITYLPRNVFENACIQNVINLLTTKDETLLKNTGIFLFMAMKRRQILTA